MNYNIYAGLGGGFGDAQYCGTGDFPSIEEIDIALTKENPPMGACGKSIGVSVHYIR